MLVKKYTAELAKEKAMNDKKLAAKKITKEKTELDQQTLDKLREKMEKEDEVGKWKDYHKAIVKELTSGFTGTNEEDDAERKKLYDPITRQSYLFTI